MTTARTDFNLLTQEQVQSFIANDGLENLQFKNSEPLDAKWGFDPLPMADAYTFTTGTKAGYLAFFYSPYGRWIIKSFKSSTDGPTLTHGFRMLEILKPKEEKRLDE